MSCPAPRAMSAGYRQSGDPAHKARGEKEDYARVRNLLSPGHREGPPRGTRVRPVPATATGGTGQSSRVPGREEASNPSPPLAVSRQGVGC
ncbi:MAG: hypothetical protein VCA55_12725 [Verrucomicrobiales bacterium]